MGARAQTTLSSNIRDLFFDFCSWLETCSHLRSMAIVVKPPLLVVSPSHSDFQNYQIIRFKCPLFNNKTTKSQPEGTVRYREEDRLWQSQRRRARKGRGNIWRKSKIFTNLMKDMTINIPEAQWTPSKMTSKRPTTLHIIIKILKDKDKRENFESSKRVATYTRDQQ